MTEKTFFEPSPQLLSNARRQNKFKSNLPWREVPVGKSFIVAYSETRYPNDPEKSLRLLRSSASQNGKSMGRVFKVYDHGPAIGFEVGCLAYRGDDNVLDEFDLPEVETEKPNELVEDSAVQYKDYSNTPGMEWMNPANMKITND